MGMSRVRCAAHVPGNSPAALERASGRWGPKGRRRGALPLAALASPAALGARGLCDTPNGRLAGWRVGDARDLTRSRGFATAGFGARLHLPASVVEVHVAARRLRRIVPVGIRPNGTIRLGERGRLRARPDPSNCRRAFFIMRKAVAAIRWRNTLFVMPLAIQKTADQANNPAYLCL